MNNTYTVKAGDTLSAIAKKYNTTVAKLALLNNIQNVNLIRVGQVLTVSERVSNPVPNDSELATALRNCLSDVEKLDSFKKLCSLL